MTLSYLIKQPWFQVILAIIFVISVLIGIYYYGKSQGRADYSTKFDSEQALILKQAQEAESRAAAWKNQAENAIYYSEKLKDQIGKDRSQALMNEERITSAYNEEQKEILTKYEEDKNSINDPNVSNCDRCRDLCERSNRLTIYGPEFASAKCNADTYCTAACNP